MNYATDLQAQGAKADAEIAGLQQQVTDANQAVVLANASKDAQATQYQKQLDAANQQHASDQQAILALQQQAQNAVKAAAMVALPPNCFPIPADLKLKAGTAIAPVHYFASGPVTIPPAWQPPANVALHGNGFPLTVSGGTGIDCRWGSANFELTGFAISCPPNCTIIEGGAYTNWHDCSVETSFAEGMVQRSPQAKGCIVQNIVCRKPHGARLVLVVGADGSITRNNTSPGSTGEAVFRSIKGDDGHVPQYTVVTGNDFGYANNLQKPPLDLRWGNGFLVACNKLGEWTRMGEEAGLTATNILYLGNVHSLGPTGIPPVQLMGSSAHVDMNILNLTANMQGIALGGASVLLSANGNTKVSTDGKPLKPLGPGASDGTGTITK